MPRPVVDGGLVALAAFDVWQNLFFWGATSSQLAVATLACGALLFRRRFPLTVFLLTVPASLLVEMVVAPLAALFTLGDRSCSRWLLAGCATLSAAASVVPWPPSGIASDDRTWTLIQFVYLLAMAATPVLLGQLVQARRDVGRQLVEIEERREHEQTLHEQTVLARERAQLAREMHDVVSHQVSLIAVRAGALQVAAKDVDAREAARTIRSLSVGTLDELRHMVTLLRASGTTPTELTPQPTLADLHRLVATSAIDAQLTGDLPDGIGATAQRTVYRTVQEALTNVRKHAPGAIATVRLWHHDTHFGVEIINTPPNRPSLPLPGSHLGLIGLKERAELLGGTLRAGPTPEGGYVVRLRAPWEAE
ncbi:putative Sensor protein UhpB [Streptomyces aurantiacus JA 4570]|uniref:histidine kinase n=1 Tax=Streptomyces aurantiacus JA 4570 TaxID=1286094 RepID=S3ZDP3_9ACTN|nr:putative Sensor protein UhpB [Streptomyces aurantiacus JA 4570]